MKLNRMRQESIQCHQAELKFEEEEQRQAEQELEDELEFNKSSSVQPKASKSQKNLQRITDPNLIKTRYVQSIIENQNRANASRGIIPTPELTTRSVQGTPLSVSRQMESTLGSSAPTSPQSQSKSLSSSASSTTQSETDSLSSSAQ